MVAYAEDAEVMVAVELVEQWRHACDGDGGGWRYGMDGAADGLLAREDGAGDGGEVGGNGGGGCDHVEQAWHGGLGDDDAVA